MTACSRVYEQLITSSEIITGDGMASFTRAVFAVDGCPSVRPSITSARAAAQRVAFDRETSGLATKLGEYAFCDPRSIAVAVHLHVY